MTGRVDGRSTMKNLNPNPTVNLWDRVEQNHAAGAEEEEQLGVAPPSEEAAAKEAAARANMQQVMEAQRAAEQAVAVSTKRLDTLHAELRAAITALEAAAAAEGASEQASEQATAVKQAALVAAELTHLREAVRGLEENAVLRDVEVAEHAAARGAAEQQLQDARYQLLQYGDGGRRGGAALAFELGVDAVRVTPVLEGPVAYAQGVLMEATETNRAVSAAHQVCGAALRRVMMRVDVWCVRPARCRCLERCTDVSPLSRGASGGVESVGA
jgi:hypothetical protein